MGGFGSGRTTSRPIVEGALRLDVDRLMRLGVMRPGARTAGSMSFPFYEDQIDLKFEGRLLNPSCGLLRLQYVIRDYDSGEPRQVDDWIELVTSQPNFGGQRWWFVCSRTRRRVRKLYLPLGARHFRSRRAYKLAYGCQRESVHERAERRARKLRRRLGGDPDGDEYPRKPKRMRWRTYELILNELVTLT
jgi:hypothetical protein